MRELIVSIFRQKIDPAPANSKLNIFRFLRDFPGRIYSCFKKIMYQEMLNMRQKLMFCSRKKQLNMGTNEN